MLNYITWNKGQSILLSAHFKTDEFTCHCSLPTCIQQKISSELITKAEIVRRSLAQPIVVTSGYRCPEYQKLLTNRGYQTATNSQHCLGNAWDCSSADMKALREELNKEFMALGVALNFIHSDLRTDKKRLWFYKGVTS